MSISVVMPCYNRADILPRSIESVRQQTHAVDEVVLVDDGSSDGSADVARKYGDLVRVLEQENAGAAAARNKGIREAKGDWIAFLDSDDVWDSTKIEKQLATAERFPQAKLVFCDTVVYTGDEITMPSRFGLGGLYGAEVEKDGDMALYDRALFKRMITQSRVITSAVMVRNDLPELEFAEHIWGSEDWYLWLRLALRYPFASIDQLLTTMYMQGDNISGRKGKLYRNDVKVLKELLEEDEITESERQALARELRDRRIGAVYFSLLNGETKPARRLISEIEETDLDWKHRQLYRIVSYLPSWLAKAIGCLRC
jgi:glycosyltransferase involved in cell wall biosynthesis